MTNWWLSPTPLKNDGQIVRLDQIIPNLVGENNPFMFQSAPTRLTWFMFYPLFSVELIQTSACEKAGNLSPAVLISHHFHVARSHGEVVIIYPTVSGLYQQ